MKKNKLGFTLVELIVVITILAILSTMGFVAYTDYLTTTRDSTRFQQMSSLHNALTLHGTRMRIPLSENMISVTFSGAQIGYQGDLDQDILDKIKYSDGGKDPKTKTLYTYFLGKGRKDSQILGFFEEENSQITSVFDMDLYADYNSLHPKVVGENLGTLLEENTNTPVQRVDSISESKVLDILTSTGNYVSYVSNTEFISGDKNNFLVIVPGTSCKSIKSFSPYSKSGIYKINPAGDSIFEAYCDMETDGGGWTLIARNLNINVTSDPSFGWLIKRGSIYDDAVPFSMGPDSKKIRFGEILWAPYNQGKTPILPGEKMLVDSNALRQEVQTSVAALEGCNSSSDATCSREIWNGRAWWGAVHLDDIYHGPGREGWFHNGVKADYALWKIGGGPGSKFYAGIMIFVR